MHQNLDDETRQVVARTQGSLIVEGRFLNYVLGDESGAILVRLLCEDSVREARQKSRGWRDRTIQEEDRSDARTIRTLYPACDTNDLEPLLLDTTNETTEDLAAILIARFE